MNHSCRKFDNFGIEIKYAFSLLNTDYDWVENLINVVHPYQQSYHPVTADFSDRVKSKNEWWKK